MSVSAGCVQLLLRGGMPSRMPGKGAGELVAGAGWVGAELVGCFSRNLW